MFSATLDALMPAAPTQTRPCTRVPSIVKNRRLGFSISLTYSPSSVTWANWSSSASRGTRTASNRIRPLSTPLRPIFGPSSVMVTPGRTVPPSRMGTTSACTPWLSPPTTSCAKTTASWACFAALPM